MSETHYFCSASALYKLQMCIKLSLLCGVYMVLAKMYVTYAFLTQITILALGAWAE